MSTYYIVQRPCTTVLCNRSNGNNVVLIRHTVYDKKAFRYFKYNPFLRDQNIVSEHPNLQVNH